MEFSYAALSRLPDVEAPNLQAWDATDELLVAQAIERTDAETAPVAGDEIVVIGDDYGAITLALDAAGIAGVRVHQDVATGRLALARNAAELGLGGHSEHELDSSLLERARLVLLKLPKSLAELEELVDAITRWAAPDVVVVAGGRVKHMTLTQNEVLGGAFALVQPQRAARKSRLIVASGPLLVPDDPPFPVSALHEDPSGTGPLTLCAHGAVFAGERLDIGTRALLEAFGPLERRAQLRSSGADQVGSALNQSDDDENSGVMNGIAPDLVVDLGCGTGALAVAAARRWPAARVIATDRSAAAVASAMATVVTNGLASRVEVVHDDAGAGVPDAAADLVLLNPPFHLGQSVHTGAATRLFEAASRMLRRGGELWCVFNSSLGYRGELTRLIGETEQISRTPKFTVVRSIRR